MTLEQIFPELDPALGQSDVGAVAKQEPKTDFSTDPKSQIVAQDRASRSAGDYDPNVQRLGLAGVERCRNKGCFSGEWEAHALQADDYRNPQVAVLLNKVHARLALRLVAKFHSQ